MTLPRPALPLIAAALLLAGCSQRSTDAPLPAVPLADAGTADRA